MGDQDGDPTGREHEVTSDSNYLPPESFLRLLDALRDGTDANRIRWTRTDSRTFLFEGSTGSVVLTEDRGGGAPYRISVYDMAGGLIESHEAPTQWTSSEFDDAMERLYGLVTAQERATTIDPIIDSLIADATSGSPAQPPSGPAKASDRRALTDDNIDELPF